LKLVIGNFAGYQLTDNRITTSFIDLLTEIWPLHSQGPSEQKTIEKFGEREHRHMQGLSNFF